MDKRFKKQFKLSFIKSLKSGFDIDEIKKRLKNQSYPSDLINDLIEELESDEEIMELLEPLSKQSKQGVSVSQGLQSLGKPGFFEKLKTKLFKLNEEQKIKYVAKLISKYYNLIIEEKRKLNQEQSDIDDIMNNLEKKKLLNYFIKNRESKIKYFLKKFEKLRVVIKKLREVKLKPAVKTELNNIIDFINTEENNLTQETESLKQIKASLNQPDQLKKLIQNEKTKLKQKENPLQQIINQISRKSPKFKEAISQL